MKTNIKITCLLAVLLPTLALAAPKNGKGPRNMDANGDRVITQPEAESVGAQRLIQNFSEIDADGNGQLTRKELRAHRENRMQKRMFDRRGRAQDADTDDNGTLSYDEASVAGMRRLVDNFDAIDSNGDGEVTRREMRNLRQTKDGKGRGQGEVQNDGQGQGGGLGQSRGDGQCRGQGGGQGRGQR